MQNRWTDSAEGPRGLVQEIRHSLGSLVANNDVTQIAELGRLQRVLGTIEQRFAGRRAELMAMGTIQEAFSPRRQSFVDRLPTKSLAARL